MHCCVTNTHRSPGTLEVMDLRLLASRDLSTNHQDVVLRVSILDVVAHYNVGQWNEQPLILITRKTKERLIVLAGHIVCRQLSCNVRSARKTKRQA